MSSWAESGKHPSRPARSSGRFVGNNCAARIPWVRLLSDTQRLDAQHVVPDRDLRVPEVDRPVEDGVLDDDLGQRSPFDILGTAARRGWEATRPSYNVGGLLRDSVAAGPARYRRPVRLHHRLTRRQGCRGCVGRRLSGAHQHGLGVRAVGPSRQPDQVECHQCEQRASNHQ